MSEDEIKGYIETIRTYEKKKIKEGYEKCRKLRQSMIKSTKKVKESSVKLIEETDPQLTEEGVQKITKKGKIYFRSLKEINRLVHYTSQQFSDFQIPNPSQKLTSTELNQFIRVVSRAVNDVNRERATADKVMGLDFMLKKRSVYVPLSKIGSDLSTLRDIQKEEYRIIKILEDLENLVIDVRDILNKITETESDLERLQNEYEGIVSNKTDIEGELNLIVEDPIIKESRQRGIRMTELEIEMGKHLNSFKKIFKKYAREIQRGSFSGDFGLVGVALAYEKNPVHHFLKESDDNPEIVALLEELLKVGESNLHLKQKNVVNIRKELNIINEGKLNAWKKEWKLCRDINNKDKESPEFQALNKKYLRKEEEVEKIKTRMNEKDEEIALKKKEITQLTESLAERGQRAVDFASELGVFEK